MRRTNRTLTEEIDLAAARIQALHAQLGRIPTAAEYNTASAPASTTTYFKRHCIRYSDLCARAGHPITARRKTYNSIATALDASIAAAVARIQQLAHNGLAPSQAQYDQQRNDAPSYTALRPHIAWSQLVQLAGCIMRRPGVKPNTNADGIPTDVETEIVTALAAGDHQLYQEWPLAAIPIKTETRDIPQPDGTIYRITRTYASLR